MAAVASFSQALKAYPKGQNYFITEAREEIY
jgi:hypothetical protein